MLPLIPTLTLLVSLTHSLAAPAPLSEPASLVARKDQTGLEPRPTWGQEADGMTIYTCGLEKRVPSTGSMKDGSDISDYYATQMFWSYTDSNGKVEDRGQAEYGPVPPAWGFRRVTYTAKKGEKQRLMKYGVRYAEKGRLDKPFAECEVTVLKGLSSDVGMMVHFDAKGPQVVMSIRNGEFVSDEWCRNL